MTDVFNNSKFRNYSIYSAPSLNDKSVLIAVGSLGISGGTNIILEYASVLQQSGAKVTIGHLIGKKEDIRWHPKAEEFEIQELSNLKDYFFDLGIATWWQTAYEILEIPCLKYLYFVQSLESRFALNENSTNTEALISATYQSGFPIVTIASWLQNLFMVAGCQPVWQVKNGIDKQIFNRAISKTGKTVESKKLRVLVEGALGVPMKAVEETLNSLAIIGDYLEITYVNPYPETSVLKKFESISHSYNQVPLEQMSDIYRNIDLLVKMSRVEGMFGPPLEAFHSNATAIVSKVTGYDEYIKHGYNALVVEVDDFVGLNDSLIWLSENREYLEQLKDGASETASTWPSISESALEFASICRMILESPSIGNKDKINLGAIRHNVLSLINEGKDPWSILNDIFKS
jgi:hypothetical protein